MAEQFYTILTAVGKAKIANAAALGQKVELTELALGDGGGSYYNPTEDQTELRNEVWRGVIGSVNVDGENPNWITIQTVVPSQHGGFMIREAGVFDNEGDLIAVGKYPETYKPVAADGSIKDLVIRMILEVSNAASVVLKIDPTVVLATQQQVNEAEARAKAYTDQEVAEVSQALDAHVAETVIKQNLTINVAADYPTIQAALDALKYAWIPRDVTVTIQVAAGTYTHTSPIVVDHPCGSQIQIIGATPITTTITGAGTISGSAGNWSVPITVADVTGIQVGQYAIIRNTSGTGDHFAHRGIWEITVVDTATKTVTVKNTHRASTFPTATLSGGDFIVLTTVLKFSGCHGIVSYDKSLGLLDNVALVGNNTVSYDGIYLTRHDHSTLRGGSIRCGSNVGISSFDTGARVCAGSLVAHDVAASGNAYYGFRVQYSGNISAISSTASGNDGNGFSAQYSGSISASSSTASGNGGNGFYAVNSGSISASSSTASGNGVNGFCAINSGSISASSSTASGNGGNGFSAQYSGNISASSSTASGNATDYKADKMGYIYCAGYAGTPTFSPALNTEGNYNAIITT